MSEREAYIPRARYATLAFAGWNAAGAWRCLCVRCHDESPLTDPRRIHGDDVTPDDACDACGIALAKLAEMCDAEHDEQQRRWSKQPITHVVEMGMIGDVRCRIY